MVEQKATPVSKKVATAKPKIRTSSASTGKTKSADMEAVKTTTKKVAAKKTVAAAAEPKKTKLPAAKKAAASAAEITPAARKAASVKVTPLASTKKEMAKPSPEERYRMVETAAYFIAEQHGFQGRSDEHWAAAEREIAAKPAN